MLNHTHSGTTDTQGSHTHGVNDPGHRHQVGDKSGVNEGQMTDEPFEGENFASAWTSTVGTGISIQASGSHAHNMTTGDPSSGGGAETRPRNVALLACIKF
jgi:hypothetical protein